MAWLVWIGTGLTLMGLAGLMWCIFATVKARRATKDDAILRQKMQKIVTLNMGALLISALGLMAVVTGIFLT